MSLFEDNHLLVVNKPPLLPTMGVKEGELSLLTPISAIHQKEIQQTRKRLSWDR